MIVAWDADEPAQRVLDVLDDFGERVGAMAHLQDGHAASTVIEQFGLGLLEHAFWERSRTGGEVMHAWHRNPLVYAISESRNSTICPTAQRGRRSVNPSETLEISSIPRNTGGDGAGARPERRRRRGTVGKDGAPAAKACGRTQLGVSDAVRNGWQSGYNTGTSAHGTRSMHGGDAMAIYVMSDIHGHVRALEEVLDLASPGDGDEVYVLGHGRSCPRPST